MGICKENENTICKPRECNRAFCPVGEELRNLSKSPKCGKTCFWIQQGVNETNLCKDASCLIGNTIIEFRKK